MDYRLYCVDSNSHILGPAENVTCANDGAAESVATDILIDGSRTVTTVEIWEGARYVSRCYRPISRRNN